MKCPKCGDVMHLDNSGLIRFCSRCNYEEEVKPKKTRKHRGLLDHIFTVEPDQTSRGSSQ